MRRKHFIILTIFTTLFLASCTPKEEDPIPINPDDLITMEELDDYMFRDDVQYVDLRNYEASLRSGFIYSFEMIPFFDYLDYRAFDRNNSYDFEASQLVSEEEMLRLFDKEKAIFLYADGCIRSGYVKQVLDYLGYERVYVLGGFGEYDGAHKVLGDGYYSIGSTFYAYYVGPESGYTYHISGVYELDRTITDLRIDIVDEFGISMRNTNYDSEIDYNEQLTILEEYIIRDITTTTELYRNLTNDTADQFDSIPGYTIGFDEDFIYTLYKLTAK